MNYASAKFPTPRPFQSSAREKLREGFKAGHRCQMVMSPTGSGKTILAMFLIHESLMRDKRVIFVADRRTLINQTSEVADSLGLIQHSVLMAGHWRFDPSRNFQIASAQTLARRSWPDADLIIVDEAHTQLKAVTDHIKDCRAAVIGLSATPFSAGLGKLYQNLVNATTMRELTDSGVLVPMRILSCTKVNMKDAATANGEWTHQAAQERGMEIIGDVVHEWIKHAENRKTIVFGATIAHCEAMAREFNEAGILATVFTAETSESERKEILSDFKSGGALRVLISVEALAKGFDQRDVSCVCDVRPLRKSLSTAIQMWGRGLRASPETGKKDLLLLDFSGNIVRFAEDYESIYYDGLDALDMGEKLDKTIRKDDDEEQDHPKNCPQCGFKPFRKRCISCGFETIKDSLIEHQSGEMVEFKVGRATAGNKQEVWEQACSLCRKQGNPATAKGRAYHLFKSITGTDPKGLPSFDAVPDVVVSRAVMNKAKANAIAYRASQK